MKLKNKILAGVGAAVLAVGLTTPAASASDGTWVHMNSSSIGSLYITFNTGYQSWIYPGWDFGPGANYIRVYAGQCIKWQSPQSLPGQYTTFCNNDAWNPYNQTWKSVWMEGRQYIIERTR